MENLQNYVSNKNVVYRFLDASDIPKYQKFIDNFDKIMKIEKTKDLEKSIINSINLKLSKTVGVFDENDDLILVNSGYFPENYPYWYGYDHMSIVEKLSDFAVLSHQADNLLCKYGEEKNYFAHYSRRPINHQKAFLRLLSRIKDTRYTIYNEKIYKAGEECKYLNHKFYFHSKPSFPIDTIISFHSLKQEYRDKILNLI